MVRAQVIMPLSLFISVEVGSLVVTSSLDRHSYKKKLTIAKWFAKHLLDAYYIHPSTSALKKRNYSLEFSPEAKGRTCSPIGYRRPGFEPETCGHTACKHTVYAIRPVGHLYALGWEVQHFYNLNTIGKVFIGKVRG